MRSKLIQLLILITVPFWIFCTDDQLSTGIEVTNGNCIGTIFTHDGIPAPDALVRLIPSDYTPGQSTMAIDSTYTDNNGLYEFSVGTSGFYTVFAEKEHASCMRDSVAVMHDALKQVGNDTLKASGFIAGTVIVKPGDDPCKVVILVKGTTIFVTPDDSSGYFIAQPVPYGALDITAFSTSDGYDIWDSTVIVTPGDTTIITIRQPMTGAPDIPDLTLSYDTTLKTALLQWEPLDTAEILLYTLHRSMDDGEDTILRFEPSVRFYSDDVLSDNFDSITYCLSAIGKNFYEGYSSTMQLFAGDDTGSSASIDNLFSVTFEYINKRLVYADPQKGYYFIDTAHITKVDKTLKVLAEYVIPNGFNSVDTAADSLSQSTNNQSVTARSFYDRLYPDNRGNLYILTKSIDSTNLSRYIVFKFDTDCNVIDTLIPPLEYNGVNIQDMRIVVTTLGTLYLLCTPPPESGSGTMLMVYNSEGECIRSSKLDRKFDEVCCFNDTIVGLSDCSVGAMPIIFIYDTTFTLIGHVDSINTAETFYPYITEDTDIPLNNRISLLHNSLYCIIVKGDLQTSCIISDFQGMVHTRIEWNDCQMEYVDRNGFYVNYTKRLPVNEEGLAIINGRAVFPYEHIIRYVTITKN